MRVAHLDVQKKRRENIGAVTHPRDNRRLREGNATPLGNIGELILIMGNQREGKRRSSKKGRQARQPCQRQAPRAGGDFLRRVVKWFSLKSESDPQTRLTGQKRIRRMEAQQTGLCCLLSPRWTAATCFRRRRCSTETNRYFCLLFRDELSPKETFC